MDELGERRRQKRLAEKEKGDVDKKEEKPVKPPEKISPTELLGALGKNSMYAEEDADEHRPHTEDSEK